IARVDPETYRARVSEARAALKMAQANVKRRTAALERMQAAVANAEADHNMAGAQLGSLRAKFEETDKQLERHLALIKGRVVSASDLDRARAQRNSEVAGMRAASEQITMKKGAIGMTKAELQMAEADLLDAEAAVEEKQAALEQAQLDLARTELRSPIDGIVIKRDVNPGQTIAVSLEAKTLFKIANDLRIMEIHGKIDEADVGRLKTGQQAQFTVDAYPDRTFRGKVIQIRKSPEVTQGVVTYTAVISARNEEMLLLPGMTAQLRIFVADSGEVLKVPNQALRFRPSGHNAGLTASAADTPPTVWVVDADGQAAPVTVTLGASDDSSTEITEAPLAENERVIVGIGNSQNQKSLLGVPLGF
ncbi:MAG TPA: efflux RND transporter periplasmic adaptor subunit, partial [Methylocystis sp.]